MPTINKIKIGNTEYDIQDTTSGYSKVQISNLLSSGEAVGTITLNGTNYIIYAPSSSSGGLEVSVSSNNLIFSNSSESPENN